MKINLKNITTETRNENSLDIDIISIEEAVKIINDENLILVPTLKSVEKEVSECIKQVTKCFSKNGRLIYIGAGTSGRMGVLDASECVPTFSVSENMVIGIIAGGDRALRHAVENAEDNEKQAILDLENINLCSNDIVIGLSASGRTPYVKSAIIYANKIGCKTVSISHSKNSQNGKYANINIEAVSGAEVLTGSTRLKAGTMTKLILNTITTISMIQIGKSYSNYMVDVKTSNVKLVNRAIDMIVQITSCSQKEAKMQLKLCENKVKNAIICILMKTTYSESELLLKNNNGKIRKIIENFE